MGAAVLTDWGRGTIRGTLAQIAVSLAPALARRGLFFLQVAVSASAIDATNSGVFARTGSGTEAKQKRADGASTLSYLDH
jgi:hypothetical protein